MVRSNSDTRASISLISSALAARLTMISAARTRVEAGVFWSSITFMRIVAAAEDPCWSRAVVCPYAARRAARKVASNSASFCQRKSVLTAIPTVRAASSSSAW